MRAEKSLLYWLEWIVLYRLRPTKFLRWAPLLNVLWSSQHVHLFVPVSVEVVDRLKWNNIMKKSESWISKSCIIGFSIFAVNHTQHCISLNYLRESSLESSSKVLDWREQKVVSLDRECPLYIRRLYEHAHHWCAHCRHHCFWHLAVHCPNFHLRAEFLLKIIT